jgi:Kdo2-lipid IVA lauroyltransferase/acyltransferase
MYYLVYGLMYLCSLLPLLLLYLLSDFAAFLVGDIIRYRRRVILDNLLKAFPEKTEAERKRIARSFYHHFADSFIETLKLLSASDRFIQRHFAVDNPELYEQYFAQGRKGQLHLGHIFNWELANLSMPLQTAYTFIVIYMPLTNKIFDRLFTRLRSRTGTVLVSATQTRKEMLPYRNQSYLLTLVADQSPGDPANAYWLNFFGHPAAFVRSPERGARAGNIPVFFAYIYRKKRGYYGVWVTVASENPNQLPEGELTRRYAAFMEDCVRKDPTNYLWSHKRWKYAWKQEYEKCWIGSDKVPQP